MPPRFCFRSKTEGKRRVNSVETFRTLYGYHHAAWRRIWEIVAGLSEEQYTRSMGYSHGSIADQMFHAAQVDTAWLLGLRQVQGATRTPLNPAHYPTREALRARWEETAQAWDDYLAGLSDADLAAILPGMGGPVWHVLLHVANHGTDHRAQTLRFLHDLGAPTFPQDMIFFLWPRP